MITLHILRRIILQLAKYVAISALFDCQCLLTWTEWSLKVHPIFILLEITIRFFIELCVYQCKYQIVCSDTPSQMLRNLLNFYLFSPYSPTFIEII